MRWKGREQSQNVEDRRGMGPGTAVAGGGIGVLVVALIAMFMGADQNTLQRILGQGQNRPAVVQNGAGAGDGIQDEAREFISVTLRDTEKVWEDLFQRFVQGDYRAPKLIIFEDQVRSGCGMASAAMGPFYCPADKQVYIDPSFFDQLARRHDAPGDFAQAYVIAHEVAHHVQELLGQNDRLNEARQRRNETLVNQESVRLELQADFLAGVWAHHAHKKFDILEDGDIEEGINAANQIGDDTLQLQAQGYVEPKRFTHGTSKQRMRWFKQGLMSGDPRQMTAVFEMDYREL